MALSVEEQLERIKKHKIRESLIYSVLDGSAFAVMAGFGESYLNAFLVELKASNQQMGLFTSLPQLIGSGSQVLSAALVNLFKKRRILILLGAFLQALAWIPLILIPFLPNRWWLPLALLSIVLYFVFGNIISPAWNSLIGDLVPAESRGAFFGKRNKVVGCITFLSVFVAGLILNFFQQNNILLGFSILFVIALFARFVSLCFLAPMVELPYSSISQKSVRFFSFLCTLHNTNAGLFILYLCLMNFSVQIAGPFFSVFMLREQQFTYFEFMLVNVAAIIAQFLAMTYWGTSADYYGNKKIITITGVLLPIVPWFWLPSSNVLYLVAIQIASGFAWAGFNLSSANFIFDNTASSERVKYFAYYNVLNGFAIFAGAMLGGFLATHITDRWIFASSLQFLFLISGFCRAIVSFVFLPRIREVRIVHPAQTKELFWNLVALRPMFEIRYEIVLWITKLGDLPEKIGNMVEEKINRIRRR